MVDRLKKVELITEANRFHATPKTIDDGLVLLRDVKMLKAMFLADNEGPVKEQYEAYKASRNKLSESVLDLDEAEKKLREKLGQCVLTYNLTKDDISAPGITFRQEFDTIIDDPDLVPRQHCSPDEKKLKTLARTMKGHAQIPGVRFVRKIIINVKENA